MSAERAGLWGLAAGLVLAGAIAWAFELRPALRVDASSLANLPAELHGWRSRDIPLEETVESMLQADFNLQRMYTHPVGDLIWLYVGYYGTDRGGHPEHAPAQCYPASGWAVDETRTVVVDPHLERRVNEYVVERDGERRLVHFWYRSSRRTGMLGTLSVRLDHLLGRLKSGRADGALVRISTPLDPDDEVTARSRLLGFAAALEEQLAEHWPVEVPSR